MGMETTPAGTIECVTHGLVSEVNGACAGCLAEQGQPDFLQCPDHGSQKKTAAGICPLCEALGRKAPLSAMPTPGEVAAAIETDVGDVGSPIGTAPFQSTKTAAPKPDPPGEAPRWRSPAGAPNRGR